MQPISDPNETPKPMPEARAVPPPAAAQTPSATSPRRTSADSSASATSEGQPARGRHPIRPPPPPYAEIAKPLPHDAAATAASADSSRRSQQQHARTQALFDHKWSHLGLPTGYFLLRNAAQGKTLDLIGHRQSEGADLGLHPIKQPILEGATLQHKGNNQVFFLAVSDGTLTAAASSRSVDVQDTRLVQAFPHPVTTIPSILSHPIPRFRLDPETSTLHVLYETDPSYPGPQHSSEEDWRADDYIVEAVPRKRKTGPGSSWTSAPGQVLSELSSTAASFGERIAESFAFFTPISRPQSQQNSPKIGSDRTDEQTKSIRAGKEREGAVDATGDSSSSNLAGTSTAVSTEDRPSTTTITVEHDEVEEDPDSDDEPSAYRAVRVVKLERGWREKFPADALRATPDKSFGVTKWSSSPKELRKWRRRMWDVIPVTIRSFPAPDFPVHTSRATEDLEPPSASESASATDSDDHHHLSAGPGAGFVMADYFGIGSHTTSTASSPSRSRRMSHDPAAEGAELDDGVHAEGLRWASPGGFAASRLSGMISSRLLPLSLGGEDAGELADGEGEGLATESQATPRLPRDEWDANIVGSRELDRIAQERKLSTSSSSADGSTQGVATTLPPPVPAVGGETKRIEQ
ncbi:hypothetical protein BMF94_2954 [Rhodotorula taiwanensis]|uniref:Uncharacterized protein n=1 Tax=Rhodotorula taiwanensis TaxID=741276 RepID=A0A2S5BBI0_9BASI|nr:hypothetical protein BMF94_2954 [Rhodotorula taiwanensis]